MGEVKIPDKIKCQNTLDVNWACSLIRDLIILRYYSLFIKLRLIR